MKPNNLFCLGIFLLIFPLTILAQKPAPVPDPGQTYGSGSTMRTNPPETNPETMIPETKTEFFDENGTLRKEVIKTQDFDGNSVEIVKKYDNTGNIEAREEVRKDPSGRMVYTEDLEYFKTGDISFGLKSYFKDGKWVNFDYDTKKGEYVYTNSTLYGKLNLSDKLKSKFSLTLGVSYKKMANAGPKSNFPLGLNLGLGFRIAKNLNFSVNASGHSNPSNKFSTLQFNLNGGIEKSIPVGNDEKISLFSRIAIGMMHERRKMSELPKTSTLTVPSGMLGGGMDIRLAKNFGLNFAADWLPDLINGQLQSNTRFTGGFKFDFTGKK